jgi:hypothetical protein
MKWKKKVPLVILLVISIIALVVLLSRVFGLVEIDDVNPYMNCDDNYLKKADIFYVVPEFNNISINESRAWCDYILSLNKTLYLHGIRHTYNEFNGNISNEDFQYALDVFYDCFGYYPTNFKPPQVAISSENKKLVKKFGLNLDLGINQVMHTVYHCNDSGILSNKVQDLL